MGFQESGYRVRGINDDTDTCMQCGKTGLKRVVWLEDAFGFDAGHYGTTCAARKLKIKGTTASMKRAISEQYVDDRVAKRSEYFRKQCFVDPSLNVFIERGYQIGKVMRENDMNRNEAVQFIREDMAKRHWFLRELHS